MTSLVAPPRDQVEVVVPALPEAVRARAAVYDFLRSRLSRIPG
jgi:hypothetical protein